MLLSPGAGGGSREALGQSEDMSSEGARVFPIVSSGGGGRASTSGPLLCVTPAGLVWDPGLGEYGSRVVMAQSK